MLSGLAVMMLAGAQAAAAPAGQASYGPALPPKPKPVVKAPPQPCPPPTHPGEVVVCAQKPQGYRLDPDVMEAKRRARDHTGGPKRPETFADKSCASVGPRGCVVGGGINLLNAAVVAATMASKAAKGESIGKMFVTDPQLSEYELYQQAKREREAKEAEQAAKAKAKEAAGARAAAVSAAEAN